jgi:hypothetical protein
VYGQNPKVLTPKDLALSHQNGGEEKHVKLVNSETLRKILATG